MKKFFRALFSPILAQFESDETEYDYKPSHRKILIAVGCLFLVLSGSSVAASFYLKSFGALLPIVVFTVAGVICLVVGSLGSDAAVAQLWKRKQ